MQNVKHSKSRFVPIREWTPNRLLLTLILLFAAVCLFTENACAAESNEQIQKLYKQYMETPSDKLYKMGRQFLERQQFDEAMVCFTIVGNRYDPTMSKEEKRTCAFAMNNAGAIAQLRSSYSTAFSYYMKAIQVADEPVYQSYNNIAGIYLFYKDYQNARSYLTQSFDISMQQHDWQALANSMENIMFLNWHVDSVGLSEEKTLQYERCIALPHDSTYQYIMAIAEGMRAESQGHYAQAIELFKKVRSINSLSSKNSVGGNNSLLYIGRLCMKQHNYPEAIRYLKQAEAETKADGSAYMLMEVYELLIESYQKSNNAEATRMTKYDYMNLKDSINTAEELGKIKNIEFFHEVDRYEKEVVKLNQEKNMRSIVAIVSTIALVAVVLFLIFAIRQNRKLWESNKDLYRKNDQLVQQADNEKRLRSNFAQKAKAYEREIETLKKDHETHHEETEKPAYATTLDDELRSNILEKIYQQMDDVDFISQQDLTVERLAQAVGSNEKYVSQVINESLNKNFNTLLNEYRIREICKRLTDLEHFGHMTNETIAEGLGYKSRSHFTRTFKKVTGLTPSQYQKIAKSEHQT